MRLPSVESSESAEGFKEMQHERHAYRRVYFSEILMESVNTNIPYYKQL